MSDRRLKLVVWVVALTVSALGFGAVAAYGYYGLRWGCPSNAAVDRPRSPETVVRAFADGGIDLQPGDAPFPTAAGAQVYEHRTATATLLVVVCNKLCRMPEATKVDFSSGQGRPQVMRYGIGFANVSIFVADSDRRAAKPLFRKTNRIVKRLTPNVDDRCYVG